MRKSFALLAAGVLLFIAADKVEFKEFQSKEGRFKVLIPGTPKELERSTAGIRTKMYVIEIKNNGAYMAAYADKPGTKDAKDDVIEKVLKASRDGVISNFNGKLLKDSSIKLNDKYPGRDFEVELEFPDDKSKRLARLRIYLVDGRLYQVHVLGTKEFVTSDEATKFLDSFALIK